MGVIIKKGNQGSPLYFASEKGLSAIVRHLLKQSQIEVNGVYGSKRRTALLAATESLHFDTTSILILCPKVDINIADSSGETAIHMAEFWTINVFAKREEFLQNETNTCCISTNDKLLKAAEMGFHKDIKGLAKCPNANINIADFKGRRPLYLASVMHKTEAVKALLTVPQIDPNKGTTTYGKTPFSISSEKGYDDVMELLLNNSKVNVNEGWMFDSWSSFKKDKVHGFSNIQNHTSALSRKGKNFILYLYYESPYKALIVFNFHRFKM